MIINNIPSQLSLLTLLLFNILLINLLVGTSMLFSLVFFFLVILSYIVLAINGMAPASLGSLFFITFIVFIGGRFIFALFNYSIGVDFPLDGLFDLQYMAKTSFTYDEQLYIFTLVVSWIVFFSCGYLSYLKKNTEKKVLFKLDEKVTFILWGLFFIVGLLLIAFNLYVYKLSLVQGYESIFINGKLGFGKYLKYIFLSLLPFAILNSKYRNISLVIFFLFGLTASLPGSRGQLIVVAFSLLFIAGIFHAISLKKIIIYMLTCYLGLFVIVLVSPRYAGGIGFSSFLFDIFDFFYARGGILGLVGFSVIDLKEIPYEIKLGAFIPFIQKTIAAINGETLSSYEYSFNTYLSYKASPDMFYKGFGLGSSVVSESFLLFNSVPIGLGISYLFGRLVSYIQANIYKNRLVFFLATSLSSSLFFIVRDSFDSIFLLTWYLLFLYFLISIFIRFLESLKKRAVGV